MIAIVPARGGSKGLPGKNIRAMADKPMIAHTILEALKSKYINEVIVSTDDQVIADIADEYGASCPFIRPDNLSQDDSLAVDNYIYTIDRLNKDFGYSIDDFIVLQPTSPLRTVGDIDGAIELFKSKNADSVISYVQETHPVSWHKYINEDNRFEDIFQNKLLNRQDCRESYYPNGAIYVFKYSLIKSRQYYSENSFAFIMPKNRSVDIDYIDDFEYAEFLLRKRNAKK